MNRPSLIDSVASTQTMVFVRSTATGTWRTAFWVLAGFVLWALLERGAPLEALLEMKARTFLEAQRIFLGPLLLLPVLISSGATWRRLRSSPALPGRPTLTAVTAIGVLLLGFLAPWQVAQRQAADERLARETLLPAAWALWRQEEIFPPATVGWKGFPLLRSVVDEKFVAVVDLPWVSGGALGVTRQGQVEIVRENRRAP